MWALFIILIISLSHLNGKCAIVILLKTYSMHTMSNDFDVKSVVKLLETASLN